WIMGQKYIQVLASLGALPCLIPLLPGDEETLRCLYGRLDGVFLTGGVDVDPINYGELPDPLCGVTDPDRDWTELRLIRWAMAAPRPVLGVCRGHQVINVAAGGTLYQDVATQRPHGIKHDYFPSKGDYTRDSLVHEVEVQRQTRLGHILGAPRLPVNSMHHQG